MPTGGAVTGTDGRRDGPVGGGYRGADRRARATPIELGRAWRLAGLLLTGFVGFVAWLTISQGVLSLGSFTTLRATAMAVTAVLCVTSVLTWRATGEMAGLRVGVFAALLVAVGVLDAAALDTSAPDLLAIRTAAMLVAAGFLAAALWGPDVDTSTDVLRELGRAVVATAAVWAVLALVLSVPASRDEAQLLHVIGALPWFGLGVVGVLRAAGRRSYLLAWVAWSALTLAMAESARGVAVTDGGEWLAAAAAVRLSGMFVAAIGATLGLARHVLRSRDDLFRLELLQRAREQAIVQEQAERAHEVRNALFSIEGATLTLNRYRDRLAEDDQTQLVNAIMSSIAQLRELVVPRSPDLGVLAPFRLLDVIRDQVLLARGHGLPVLLEFDGDEDMLVRANRVSTGQILNNLLANARRHAGAGEEAPVVVQVDERDGTAIVRVIDSGGGVPPAFTEAIFEPGVRLEKHREGDGLGLSIARQLARVQGGDLVLEPSDRGARFVLTLPVAEPEHLRSGGGVVTDEPQQRRQVGE